MWVQFEGRSSVMASHLRTKLRLAGCQFVVSGGSAVTLAEILDDHFNWAEELAKGYSQRVTKTEKPQILIPSRCGLVYLTTEEAARGHILKCKACQKVAPPKVEPSPEAKTPSGRHGPIKTLFRIPGLPEFSINGLLSVMQERFDLLMALAQKYDSTIRAIKRMEELEAEVGRLTAERTEHAKALAVFMEKR